MTESYKQKARRLELENDQLLSDYEKQSRAANEEKGLRIGAEIKLDNYERAFSQLYQVIGTLLWETNRFDTDAGQAALDVACDGVEGNPWKQHSNLLPWPWDQ